jgi:hypothetical protein
MSDARRHPWWPKVDFTLRIPGIETMSEERFAALEELIRLCRRDGLDGEIAHRPPVGLTPPPWWENTFICIAATGQHTASDSQLQHVVDGLNARATEWAESRVRDSTSTRPQSITIFGPTGLPVHKLQVTQETIGPSTSRIDPRESRRPS